MVATAIRKSAVERRPDCTSVTPKSAARIGMSGAWSV